MNNIGKKLLWFFGSVILVAYLAGAAFFSMNTFPNTTVNGLDKSLVSKDSMFDPDPNYGSVLVKGRDKKEININLDDIEFEKSVKGKPEHNQNALLWPFGLISKHDYKIAYNHRYNKAKLDEIIKASGVLDNQIDPVNAKIEYNEAQEKYEITPEVNGSKISLDKVKEAIMDGIDSEKKEIELEKYYENAKITAEDTKLKEELKKISEFTKRKFVFDFDDRKFNLTGKELFEMYDDTDNGKVLNKDKVKDYVIELARNTDTYGTKRKFQATGIGEVTVQPGIYGWQMNVDKTVENLLNLMNSGKEGTVEIAYNEGNDGFTFTANSRKENDIGDTYIEVDLSRQKLWYYEDGKLIVTTDVVTGMYTTQDKDGFRKAATPVGVNKVWTKEKNKILKGVNENFGGTYALPINYWINIGWTGSGIHDTKERTQYGGNVYGYDGSSSCINTPMDAMKTLFERVEYGTPVVIYESSTNYSPTEFEKQDYNRARGVY